MATGHVLAGCKHVVSGDRVDAAMCADPLQEQYGFVELETATLNTVPKHGQLMNELAVCTVQ